MGRSENNVTSPPLFPPKNCEYYLYDYRNLNRDFLVYFATQSEHMKIILKDHHCY